MTTPAWISLGSNLGDRRAILDEAVLRLRQTPGVAVAAVSTYRETAPVGGPPGQGPFLNAAARLDTTLSPRELLGAMQAIERDLGRVRTVRWGERTLDLDILIYGCKFVDEPDLKLPHPRLAVRRFVLEPLAEIAPEVTDTITRRTVVDLLAGLNTDPRLLMLPDDGASLASVLSIALGCKLVLKPQDPKGVSIYPLAKLARLDLDRRDVLATLRTIGAAIGSSGSDVNRWLVTNFAIDIRSLKGIMMQPAVPTLDDGSPYRYVESRFKHLLHRELLGVPEPSLLVITPGRGPTRRPNLHPIPTYWPEATEPDAIVTEVVAICRGIEGV